MLDQDTLRPVIVSMALYISIATLVPILFKKPTNVKFVDDITVEDVQYNFTEHFYSSPLAPAGNEIQVMTCEWRSSLQP